MRREMRRLSDPYTNCDETDNHTGSRTKSAKENFTTKNTKKQSASALRRKPPKNFELGNPTDPLDRGCVSRFISCSLAQRFPPISTYKLSTIDFYSNSGLITNMETENNKPTAENDNNASRPSVWGRFMTIYTCLLPIVVLIVLVCYFHGSFDKIMSIHELTVVLYFLSVFISVFLIPFILIILIGILIYDHFKQKCAVNKSIVNYRNNSQKITLSRVCNQFHDSFIGEIIHIFLYFVMIGIIPQANVIWLFLQGIPIQNGFLAKWYVGLLYYPWIVTYVILAIVIYVLIRRFSIILFALNQKK